MNGRITAEPTAWAEPEKIDSVSAELRRNSVLIDRAVEAILRWTTPARHFKRTARHGGELGGVTVRAGQSPMPSSVAANRDEAVFPDADRFDITRVHNRRVAFGFGLHTCLGATLARMEVRLLCTELPRRRPHLKLAGEPAWSQALVVGGVKRPPIRYRTGAR